MFLPNNLYKVGGFWDVMDDETKQRVMATLNTVSISVTKNSTDLIDGATGEVLVSLPVE